MPLYRYRCVTCNNVYEIVESIKAESSTWCEKCMTKSISRVLFPPTVFDATPRTVGSQADKNSSGSSYWLDKQRHDAAASRQKGIDEINAGLPAGMTSARPKDSDPNPWWRGSTINTQLNTLTPQEKHNYIFTGNSSESAE